MIVVNRCNFIYTVQHSGALCRAAYDGGNPTAIAQSWGLTDEVEIQRFSDFLNKFGCKYNVCMHVHVSYYGSSPANLCDYITGGNGGVSGPNEQSWVSPFTRRWPTQQQNSVETQGFLNIARKLGSKCKLPHLLHYNTF